MNVNRVEYQKYPERLIYTSAHKGMKILASRSLLLVYKLAIILEVFFKFLSLCLTGIVPVWIEESVNEWQASDHMRYTKDE